VFGAADGRHHLNYVGAKREILQDEKSRVWARNS